MPASPIRPVPSNPKVPGSGVTNVSLLPIHVLPENLNTPATVFPFVVNPESTMLFLPLDVAEPPLNVPWNKLTLLPFQMLTVPPVMAAVVQPAPQEVAVPKVMEIETVPAPKAPPFTDNWLKETLRLPPETLPITVAGLDVKA